MKPGVGLNFTVE